MNPGKTSGFFYWIKLLKKIEMRLANVKRKIREDFLAEEPNSIGYIAYGGLHNQVTRSPGQ